MKTVAVIQARMGSSRLPKKVLKEIVGKPLIELLLSRLSQSKEIDQIIVATSDNYENDILELTVNRLGFKCFRGSENNVLDRFFKAAQSCAADNIVRITGDCPLIDAKVVDECIKSFKSQNLDYLSNTLPPSYPDGLDVEVMSYKALHNAQNKATSDFDREHVTPYIKNNQHFKIGNLENDKDFSGLRWTVDEFDDLQVVRNIFENFFPNILFSWKEVLDLHETKPHLFMHNKNKIRNEGLYMSKGQKLWTRAKQIIPGGNMLLSKRPEMFLPDQWPAYFSKSKGCSVWDLDNNEYTDMSIMGIGTNILGYGHPEVDEAVNQTVQKGNMSTLNCPEEVLLADKLVEMHPWIDMVRFARAGGEINSIAIRIARAVTGRDKVAICGYHGWHDWYLATNLSIESGLDSHLLPGLEPKGVPASLNGTTLPFSYNNIEELESIITNNPNQIAAIKMEVSRNLEPENKFLQKVRSLADAQGIVLIFDECTSGFRETFGGLSIKYGVEPDISLFAKALGNGYAISACGGRKEIMQAAQSTFISSTFWTERIGPTAALKTLEVMEREESWKKITKMGVSITNRWKKLAENYELELLTWGLPALTGFSFTSEKNLAYKTLICQEMLNKGFLASNSVYVSIAHTEDIVDSYFETLEPIFELIKDCEEGRDVYSLLNGPVCHSGFKRLN